MQSCTKFLQARGASFGHSSTSMSPTVVFRTTLPDVAGCKTVDMGNSATYNYRYFEPKARSFGVFQVRGLSRALGSCSCSPSSSAGDCDDSVDSLIKINKAEHQFKILTVSWNRNVTKIMHQKVVKD